MKTRFLAVLCAVMFPLFAWAAGLTQASFDANFGYTGTAQQPLMHIISGPDFTNLTLTGTTTATGPIIGTGPNPGGLSLTNNSTGSGWLLTNNTLIYLSNGVVITVVADAITNTTLTPSTALVANANQALASSVTTATELAGIHAGGTIAAVSGANLTSLNASQLTSGTVASNLLPGNLVWTNGGGNTNIFSGISITNAPSATGVHIETNGEIDATGNISLGGSLISSQTTFGINLPGNSGMSIIGQSIVPRNNAGGDLGYNSSDCWRSLFMSGGASYFEGISGVGNTLEQVVGVYANTNVTANVASTLLFTNGPYNTLGGTLHYDVTALAVGTLTTFNLTYTYTNEFAQAITKTPYSTVSVGSTGEVSPVYVPVDCILGASKSITFVITVGGTGSPIFTVRTWFDRGIDQ